MIILINTAIESFQVAIKSSDKITSYPVNYNSQVEELADVFKKINPPLNSQIIVITGPGYLTGIKIGCAFMAGLSSKFTNIYQIDTITALLGCNESPVAVRLRTNLYAFKSILNDSIAELSTQEIKNLNLTILHTNCVDLQNNANAKLTKISDTTMFDLFEKKPHLFQKSKFIKPVYSEL